MNIDLPLIEAIQLKEELNTRTIKDELIEAAKKVCWFDWSVNNDEDAVRAVDKLRRIVERIDK